MKKQMFALLSVLMLGVGAAEPAVIGFDQEAMWPRAKNIGKAKNDKPVLTLIKENDKVGAIEINQPVMSWSLISFRMPQYPCDGGTDVNKKYEGIAFEVQGDGSSEWGCILVGENNYRMGRYYFPVSDKNWKEFRVSFADMAPGGDHTLGLSAQMSVGRITEIRFTDNWKITWENKKRDAFSYKVRNLRLIEKIKPAIPVGKYKLRPLADVVKDMKAGKTALVTCFGDSITAGTGLRQGEKRYAVLLGEMLAAKFKNPAIRAVCTAVGGAHTFDSIGWMERDFTAGVPDVATMLIGYNNRSGGQSPEMYRKQLEMWLDRIAAMSKGKTAVILIPSVPGVPRWLAQDDLAQVTVEVAKKYNCTVAPIDKAIKKIGPKAYREKYLRDSVHPNPEGHQMFAKIIMECF